MASVYSDNKRIPPLVYGNELQIKKYQPEKLEFKSTIYHEMQME